MKKPDRTHLSTRSRAQALADAAGYGAIYVGPWDRIPKGAPSTRWDIAKALARAGLIGPITRVDPRGRTHKAVYYVPITEAGRAAAPEAIALLGKKRILPANAE